ncbi:unnamed protein product [Adineta steineri]|uniref:Cytochrome P450 n=1 Tax=Adineta steineri TaxID=433720 RepID=A0A814UJ84_9BILA|nr:unnamed protein product [Adineta steineri]
MSDFDDSQINLSTSIDNEEVALSKYEDELERTIQENLTNGQDLYTQKLFLAFQTAATNVTKMFRERSSGTNAWTTFHTAAQSVTMLYKESLDTLKDAIQLGILNGEQRKTKQLLRWTRRRQRRHIRTDEIYDYLVGRPPYRVSYTSEIDHTNNTSTNQPPIVDDLHTFRQALVMDDNDNKTHVDISSNRHSEQLESFVRQQVDNQLALIILIFFAFKKSIVHFIKISQTYKRIPCSPTKLPILGDILTLPLNPYKFTKKLGEFYEYAKYKDMFCLWLGTHPLLVFFHPVGLEHFFSGTKHITKSTDYIYLLPWLRTGLLTSAGTKWKNRRRILTPAFHDKDLLTNSVDIFNEQAAILIQRLASMKLDKEVNLYSYIASCALDIICETAMGLNIGAQHQRNSEYVDAVLKLTDLILKRQRMPWMWPDFVFNLLPEGREHNRCLNIVHQFTKKVIHDRAQDFHANQIHGKRSAFLDLLLKQMHEEQLTLVDIQEEVDTFMFEGHDTTAASMNFTCFMIASHPQVQQKLHEEIDRVFGDDLDRPCTIEDLNELEYLECVIKESLRLYPSVPFIAREVQEDFMYHDYKILKGSTALIFIYYIHRDPQNFPNPERFDPERFLPENSIGRSPYAYVPFSAGSRNCIGQRFAMLEEKVILSSILKRFKLKTSQSPDDLHISFEVILRSENGAHVQLELRH